MKDFRIGLSNDSAIRWMVFGICLIRSLMFWWDSFLISWKSSCDVLTKMLIISVIQAVSALSFSLEAISVFKIKTFNKFICNKRTSSHSSKMSSWPKRVCKIGIKILKISIFISGKLFLDSEDRKSKMIVEESSRLISEMSLKQWMMGSRVSRGRSVGGEGGKAIHIKGL